MSAETPPLTLRPMDRADLELFRACFAKNSPRPRSLDALRWQYLGNTTDRLFVDVAIPADGASLAAIYASLPGFMRIGGQRRLVLQSLDTLTDEAYRGRGLFVTLAKSTFARAAEGGAALIYGFPNGSSAHGFFKKLGWSSLDPVPFLIRPLRTKYVSDRLGLAKRIGPIAKLVPDVALVVPRLFGRGKLPRGVVALDKADERMTRLWDRFAAGIACAIERDEAYLQWRLFERPGSHYRVLGVEAEGGKELRALVAYTVEAKHGGRIGYVMELLHDRSFGGYRAGSRALAAAVHGMAEDGADSILAWSMRHSPNFPVYTRHGFVPLPEKMRPIELHVGVRAFDPTVASIVERRESWYFSYLDGDTT